MALFSALSACGVVGAAVGGTAAKGTAHAEATVEGNADDGLDAGESLRTAIRNLHGQSIDFGFTMTNLDLDLQVTNGTYYAEPERWAATTQFTNWSHGSRRKSRMDTTSIDGTLFMRSDEWRGAEKGCWLAIKRGFVPPYGLVTPRERPVYISILDELRPSRWTKSTTTGITAAQLPLDQALALMPEWVSERIKLKKPSSIEHRYADVVVEITEGRLLSITVTRSSLVSPLEEAGQLSRDTARFLRSITLKVTYPLNAASHAAERPSDDLVMTLEDADAGRGCHAHRFA